MNYKSYKNTISQNKSSKSVIRAYEWNSLFKILGEQANHVNAGLIELVEELQDRVPQTYREDSDVTFGGVSIDGTSVLDELALKANSNWVTTNFYDKDESNLRYVNVDGSKAMKAPLPMGGNKITNLAQTQSNDPDTNVPTKKYVDVGLATKSNTGHGHTESDITDLDKYSQSEANALLDEKIDVITYNAFIENFNLDGGL